MIFDSSENQDAYARLTDLLRSENAIAFIGAGVTLPLGYPNWETLIQRLAEAVKSLGIKEVKSNGQTITVDQVLKEFHKLPLIQAQILKDNLGEKYFLLLRELFGPKDERITSISDLISLPFRHLLTSNYDPGLEQHHTQEIPHASICLCDKSAGRFISEFNDAGTRHIVHVHGRYDDPTRIVLTESDYGIYFHAANVRAFWQAIPVTGRFVFFGFSLADQDVMFGFRRVVKALELNSENGTRHFAVMPFTPTEQSERAARIQLRMLYGIEPVFFPVIGADYSEYDDLLSRLKAEVGPPPEPVRSISGTPLRKRDDTPGSHADGLLAVEALERLKTMTRANIQRNRTGDLE